MRNLGILFICVMGSFFTSCNENGDFDEPFTPQTYDVQGKVEKGPFVSGSEISIQPMNAQLQVLGSMFNTSITDDIGNWGLGSKEFSTPYAELIAHGYFFNEVKGQLSNGTLTLRAVVDLQDNTTVNVNVLTHLKYARIKNLVASGENFDEANKQAQKELLEAFGLGSYSSKEVSSFSIIAGTDESAALIAISSLLLMDRTEAALTEYLSKLSADFGRNGCFSTEIQAQISSDKTELAKQLDDIKENVIERYRSLGISIDVKDLSHYIDWDNDGLAGNEILKGNEQVKVDKPIIEVPNEGGEFTVQIESPIALYLKPQVGTDENTIAPGVDSSEIIMSEELYEGSDESAFTDKEISYVSELNDKTLVITVSALQSKTDKSKIIKLYDYIGNEACTVELRQEGKVVSFPSGDVPRLGKEGESIVENIAINLMQGLRRYNVIEQFYAYNKSIDKVNDYVYPSSSHITNAWSSIYFANAILLQLKMADEERLNVYGDYCNVLSALYYSNLVYGWGSVPYITDYSQIEQITTQGIHRESEANIWEDLKKKLTIAIENLEEKRNESLKDANGFFFVSKDVARVLLANIHMYEGNYNDAKELLQKVVDNGFYTLDASKDFKPSTSTDEIDVTESTEVIFAFKSSDSDAGTRASITIMEPGVMPYITLSEVYLSLAECLYELGDSDTAEQHIAKILDVKDITTSETEVLMRIKDIREQILLYNGTYFAFLKRTGLAKTVCAVEDYQLLFPIPSSEMQGNRQMTQNPGW